MSTLWANAATATGTMFKMPQGWNEDSPDSKERMIIRDRTVRVLAGIERRYWFLIGSLAVTVCLPIIFLAIELDPYRSTVFSVIAGLVSFLLGFYGVVQVRRIYSQV